MKYRHLFPRILVCIVCLGFLYPGIAADENKSTAQAKKSELSSSLYQIKKADLEVKITRSQPSAYAGEKLGPLQVCCKNIGTVEIAMGQCVCPNLVLSKDPKIPLNTNLCSRNFREDAGLGMRPGMCRGLVPGESWCVSDFNASDGSCPMMIPADTPPGDYYLGVVVNIPAATIEITKQNNTHCVPIKILNPKYLIKQGSGQ